METEKDLLMYFQTSLRNVGLFTSVSFATLGYSRYYRDKSNVYNIYLIITSLIFLGVSLFISHNLEKDMEHYQKEMKSDRLTNWLVIPKVIFYFNIGVFILGLYTLIRGLQKSL